MKAYVFEGDAEEVAIALKGLKEAPQAATSEQMSSSEQVQVKSTVVCPVCGREFKNKHGMLIHKTHMHTTLELIERQEEAAVEQPPLAPDREETWSELLGESLKVDAQLFGTVMDHVAVMQGRLRYHPDGQLLGFDSMTEWYDFLSRFMAVSLRISVKMKVPNKWRTEGKELIYGG